MDEKIDVLAAVERGARELWVTGQPVNPVALDLISARAAIAELIYVAKDARDSLSAANKIYSDGAIGILIDRLSAALARVGGGK